MKTSEKIDQLAIALTKAQATMEGAKKSSTNPFYHSQYADLSEVWDTCRKPLTDNGLCFIQSIGSEKESFVGKVPIKNKDGNAIGERDVNYIWLSVTSRLLHISEQWVEDTIFIPVEADPQSIGKVTTYIRRYGQMALCGIAPEDDDAETASGRGKDKKPAEKTTSASPDSKHWCTVHKTIFFKRGEMKSYAHPIKGEDGKDTGDWCNEPSEFIKGIDKSVDEPEVKTAKPAAKATPEAMGIHVPDDGNMVKPAPTDEPPLGDEPGTWKAEEAKGLWTSPGKPEHEAPKQFSFEAEYTQANIDKFKAAREKLKLTSEQVHNILGVSGLKAWVQGGHTVDEAIAAMVKWAKDWERKEVK